MRSLCLTLLFVLPLAAEPAKSALAPAEIAEGWVQLFDGESTFGWNIEGPAKVVDGALLIGGDKPATLKHSTAFGNVHVDVAFVTEQGAGTTSITRRNKTFGSANSGVGERSFELRLSEDGTAELKIAAGKSAKIVAIKARPDPKTPLFNGKDLTGWKAFPGAKDRKVASKFTVTKEGWLNVKDGPGDLQTDGQWADFVVQLECISNGKHLNSGLFFRCLPDQYQQGYEAQIRNEWMGNDRTKPVDFGTGAIYRRQAARKVVSTDGEWFTMTLAARGKHLATWVNGYPVADWIDDRKDSDNARQGFKKDKGALSIQGHDPTTDLSFRNIRIQSLDR